MGTFGSLAAASNVSEIRGIGARHYRVHVLVDELHVLGFGHIRRLPLGPGWWLPPPERLGLSHVPR